MTLTITDETFTGKVLHKISLNFEKELVTIEQIITQRVIKEVADYNTKLPEYFNGLIVPTHAEKSLNGYKMKDRKAIDAEKQVYIALDAFQKNGFFVLVDNHQAETLKEEVLLTSLTQLSFVKLTPLVGG
ncbi:MAG: hypothetical protein HC916_04800 [Coleofasciculaceae cyanobacterium SM2_1_6]|nr:hypothetical protein [Coleofasciculaceae cyanobacterium SM2_1_6]